MHPIHTIIRVACHGPAMTRRRLRHVRRNIVLYLGAAVAAVVALAPSAGAASWVSPRVARAQLARSSELSLSQAPAGLRAAVRRTLGVRNGPLSRAFDQTKLTDPDSATGDQYGYSVAISGSTAVVGAPGTGAAYVFVGSGTTWSEQAKLTPKHGPAATFGWSVAISGSTAVVGQPGTGAAYVFVRSSTTWKQQAKLTASHASEFGLSVAIYRSTAVIGAPGGAAYVLVRSGTTWKQQAKLTPKHPNKGFGDAVAISGATAVIGAPGQKTGGTAYVFVRSGKTWKQQAKLTDPQAGKFDLFGYAVAISNSTAIIGAPANANNTGVAYVFVRSGTTWSRQATLTASDAAANNVFGISVAISDSTVVIGAPGKNSNTGVAYEFVRSGTTWTQQPELTASDGAANDGFGVVAISGSTAVTGAPSNLSGMGKAYAFTGL